MAIAYVQIPTPWQGATAAVSAPFTPGENDTILVAGADVTAYPETLTISGSSGSYLVLTPPGTFEDDFGDTWQLGYQLTATDIAQTTTVTTGGTGDFVIAAAADYSGVGSVTATENSLAMPGTGTGAVIGVSVNVPVGSVLLAMALNVGSAPVAPVATAGTTRASGVIGVNSFGYCITDYAGAGANIQPAFTSSDGATSYFTVAQFLLSPPSVLLLGQALT